MGGLIESVANCLKHLEVRANFMCHSCENYYCSSCLNIRFKDVSLCGACDQIAKNTKFCILKSFMTNSEKPEKGMFLYNFKEEILKNHKIISYIKTIYVENDDTNSIDSIVSLFVPEDKLTFCESLLNRSESC